MIGKRNLINAISLQVGINLKLIKQTTIPRHIERQVKYICTEIQKHLLRKTIDNIKIARENWGAYFKFNMPITSNFIREYNIQYVIYEYFENVNKLHSSSQDFDLFLEKLYKEKSYKVKVTDEVVEKIMSDIIVERSPNDINTQNSIKN